MPTSVAGSKHRLRRRLPPDGVPSRGFTLIELLVVLVLVALPTALVAVSLRDPVQTQLQREGERLVTLLETARVEARAAALDVRWTPLGAAGDAHFRFSGLPATNPLPTRWLGEPPAVELEGGATHLQLGPEPLLPPQALRLRAGEHQLRIASDGLKPFAVMP